MIETFKEELKETISIVKKELHNRESGIQGQGTEEELTEILSELAQTVDIVNEIEYLEKYPRTLYCAKLVKEEWEWDNQNPSEIFERLMYLEEQYEALWESQQGMGYRPYGGLVEEMYGCKIIPFHRYKVNKEGKDQKTEVSTESREDEDTQRKTITQDIATKDI